MDSAPIDKIVNHITRQMHEKEVNSIYNSLSKYNVTTLKRIAYLLKQELTFSYSKMKRNELIVSLTAHLSQNRKRLSDLIDAVKKDDVHTY